VEVRRLVIAVVHLHNDTEEPADFKIGTLRKNRGAPPSPVYDGGRGDDHTSPNPPSH
jgi:hypothetical protein